MATIRSLVTKTFLGFAAALVTLFYPGIAAAQEATVPTPESATETTQTTTTETPAPDTTGPKKPTGADGKTYKLNPETGMWENEHYIWDPVTKKTTAKNPVYTYDPETGRWSSDLWRYDAPSGKYQKVVVPAPEGPPQGALAGLATDSGCGCDGSGSFATSGLNSNTAVAMANGVTSTAISGNATVAYNTLGGNALTGNATVMSNTLNLLQSGLSLSGNGAAPTTFVANLEDVEGDLIIDPSLFALLQPASGQQPVWGNLDIEVQNDATITNDITLYAGSGKASVVSNTTGGDATTGDAHAVANVMNVANSNINSAGSFIGTINIFGDLDGDILLPPGVLDQLLASDAPTMSLDTSKIAGGNLIADFVNNTNISNNVNTDATSGAATVASNTNAGSATTGNADTNVTILNLTGHQVIGQNTLLVFVNVLGKWVGALIDAPTGTHAAAYTGGATASSVAGDLNLSSENNTGITNNINVAAASGDATVAKNTNGGDATTGDASASANILNVAGSNLSLSGWLGILFINVFGSWNGHFNEDTAAGEPDTPALPGTVEAPGPDNVKVFSVTTEGDGNVRISVVNQQSSTGNGGTTESATTTLEEGETQVVSATTSDGSSNTGAKSSTDWGLAIFGLLAAIALVLFDRFRAMRRPAQA